MFQFLIPFMMPGAAGLGTAAAVGTGAALAGGAGASAAAPVAAGTAGGLGSLATGTAGKLMSVLSSMGSQAGGQALSAIKSIQAPTASPVASQVVAEKGGPLLHTKADLGKRFFQMMQQMGQEKGTRPIDQIFQPVTAGAPQGSEISGPAPAERRVSMPGGKRGAPAGGGYLDAVSRIWGSEPVQSAIDLFGHTSRGGNIWTGIRAIEAGQRRRDWDEYLEGRLADPGLSDAERDRLMAAKSGQTLPGRGSYGLTPTQEANRGTALEERKWLMGLTDQERRDAEMNNPQRLNRALKMVPGERPEDYQAFRRSLENLYGESENAPMRGPAEEEEPFDWQRFFWSIFGGHPEMSEERRRLEDRYPIQ